MIKSIEHAMIEKGINKKELAAIASINTQSLYNSFSKKQFSVDRLQKIATALDCDIVLQDKKTGQIY